MYNIKITRNYSFSDIIENDIDYSIHDGCIVITKDKVVTIVPLTTVNYAKVTETM